MKVIFKQDYGGTELGSKRFHKGEVVELDSVLESYLTNGIVEYIPDLPAPMPDPVPEPVIVTKHDRRRTRGKSA
jgi:hypothetical protein